MQLPLSLAVAAANNAAVANVSAVAVIGLVAPVNVAAVAASNDAAVAVFNVALLQMKLSSFPYLQPLVMDCHLGISPVNYSDTLIGCENNKYHSYCSLSI